MSFVRSPAVRSVTGVLAFAFLIGACASTLSPAVSPTEQPVVAPTDTTALAPTVAEPTPAIALVDGLGRTVSLDGPAERIVSMAPSNTEILFAIGAGEQLIGRDDFSDYPAQAAEVPSIGSTYGELNTETIVGLAPDLVLAASITPPEHIEALEAVGLTVFVVGNPDEFADLFDNLELVGRLTGHEPQAIALADNLAARYEVVVTAVQGLEPVSVFYEVDASDPAAPWTTGSGTFQQLMFELAGAQNVAADLQGWGQLSLEELVVRDPQVIIFGAGPFVPTTVDSLKARPGWGTLAAVEQDRVYAVDTDLLDLPGPRLVEGLEQVARLLHPEAFPQ